MFEQVSRKPTNAGAAEPRVSPGRGGRPKQAVNPVWQALTWRTPEGEGRSLQRKCACGGGAPCDRCSSGASSRGEGIQGDVEGALRSGGEPLPRETRAGLEARFGHDLGRVRVHSGERAATAAASVQARAFTVGEHIVWGGGQRDAFAGESRGLLAHEVTHTLQQGGRGGFSAGAAGVSQPGDPAERQADHMEQLVSQEGPASAPGRAPGAPLRPSATPVHIARAPVASDKEVSGLFAGRAGFPDAIYFDRGSSTLDAAEAAKVTAAGARFSGKNIELHGFRSEEEAATTATDRINAVETKLAPVHTGAGAGTARDARPKPGDSAGQFNYREWRKVDIVAAGRPAATSSCAGVPGTVACAGSSETTFQSVRNGAEFMARGASAKLAAPTAATNALLDTFFGAGVSGAGAAHAATIKDNFDKIADSVLHTKGAAGHTCGTTCNPECATADAFNLGSGSTSLMTLCSSFFNASMTDGLRIAIILHESGHGAVGLKASGGVARTKGLEDFSYVAERPFSVLPPAQAILNSDSYTWFAAALLTPPAFAKTPQPKAPTDALDPSISSSNDVKLAVGRAQKWLRWSQQGIASLYATSVTAMDKGSWTHADVPGYGKPLMDRVAPATRFDLTATTSAPTMADRAAIAAIEDRYLAMVGTFDSRLTVKDGRPGTTTTSWSGTTLTLGTDFFALTSGSDDQVLLIVRKLVEVTSGISSGVRTAYVDFLDETQKAVT